MFGSGELAGDGKESAGKRWRIWIWFCCSSSTNDDHLVDLAKYIKCFQEHFPYMSELHELVRSERHWHEGFDCAICFVQVVGLRFQV